MVDPLNGSPAGPEGDPAAVEVHLVPLRRRHLRSVLRIEAQAYPHPWTVSLFMSELHLRTSRTYIAARSEGAVIGYAGLMYTGDEAHVTTIAVDPQWHRHKVGTRMLAHLVRVSRRRGVRHMTLEVRVANTGAQALYRKFGFAPAGIRKNYYAETREDALIMWVHDIETDDYLGRLLGIEAAIPGTTVVEEGQG